MITISLIIPAIPTEVILALTLILAPLLLLGAFQFASGAASVARHITK